jgi:hypothetical protein
MLLASCCRGGTVCVWNICSGTLLAVSELQSRRVAGGGAVSWMRGKDAELLLVVGGGGQLLVSRLDVPDSCDSHALQLLKFQPVQQLSEPPPSALFVVQRNGDASTERRLPAVEYHKKEGKVRANVIYGRVCDSGSGSGSPCMMWREVVRQVLGVCSVTSFCSAPSHSLPPHPPPLLLPTTSSPFSLRSCSFSVCAFHCVCSTAAAAAAAATGAKG